MAFQLGMNADTTNGVANVVLADSPPPGTMRQVGLVTVYNRDDKETSYTIKLYDGTNYWFVKRINTLAIVSSTTYPDKGVIIVKPGWQLLISLSAAISTQESHVTAHWADEIDEGDNAG